MTQQTFDSLVSIDHDGTIELHDAMHTAVVCLRGCLWMHRGRMDDGHLLQAGESRRIGPEGGTLVTALAPSLVCLLGPSGAPALPCNEPGGAP